MILIALLAVGIVLVLLLGTGVIPMPQTRAERRASLRAEALLRELLSPSEYAQLKRLGYLEVPSRSRPYRVYHVPAGRGTVTALEHGTVMARLCLQPAQPIPLGEAVLVHKVLLEASEEDYWRRANVLGCWPATRYWRRRP